MNSLTDLIIFGTLTSIAFSACTVPNDLPNGDTSGTDASPTDGTSGLGTTSGGPTYDCTLELAENSQKICGIIAGETLCYLKSQPLRLEGVGGFAQIIDLNNDRLDDIIVQESTPEKIWILSADPDCGSRGGFMASTIFTASSITDILSLDANEDIRVDILMRNLEIGSDDQTFLFLGKNLFEFEHMLIPNITTGTADSVGDINLDGHIDILSRIDDDLHIYLGTGTGGFKPGPVFDIGASHLTARTVDFNNDGYPDVVTSRDVMINDFESTSEIEIHFGDSTQMFSLKSTLASSDGNYRLADLIIEDFNGDFYPDLAFYKTVLYGDGVGGVFSIENQPTLEGKISGVDLNGDERIDLVSSNDALINTGTSFIGGLSGLSFSSEVRPGHFNHDNRADLATVNFLTETPTTMSEVVIYTASALR